MNAYDWMNGLDAIAAHRRAWAELFHDVDVVLAPPFGCAAFPHAEQGGMGDRTLLINGQPTPYGAQIAWPSIAAFVGLPATCAPISRTRTGLPIGVQIIGPRFEDRSTIAFAGLLEEELGLKALRPAPTR
jgi:amidase